MPIIDLHLGDSSEVLKKFAVDSLDAAVCDPPYHLTAGKKGGTGEASVNLNSPAGRARITTGFMGKAWDGGDIAFRPEFWREVLRVLKPGAYLVAFGGTRTYHKLASAIELAGFEVKDALMWHYCQGFPKSLNREDGRGTALKPATEIICLAQKPRVGTYDANFEKYGTGFLNIDACRIPLPATDGLQAGTDGDYERLDTAEGGYGFKRVPRAPGLGRWPANLAHDGSEEVVADFPQSAGQLGDLNGQSKDRESKGIFGDMPAARDMPARGDSGSAARFFFAAKASTTERDTGLEDFDAKWRSDGRAQDIENPRLRTSPRANTHPCIKPIALMRWLVRLVTPVGGTVIDPFMGSGSTGVAAIFEDRGFIGIERETEYVAIAQARIREAQGPLFAK